MCACARERDLQIEICALLSGVAVEKKVDAAGELHSLNLLFRLFWCSYCRVRLRSLLQLTFEKKPRTSIGCLVRVMFDVCIDVNVFLCLFVCVCARRGCVRRVERARVGWRVAFCFTQACAVKRAAVDHDDDDDEGHVSIEVDTGNVS
jgi:hypothetical protein